MIPHFISDPDPRIYESDNYVVLDFETTNKDFGDPLNPENRLVVTDWEYQGEHHQRRCSEYELNDLVDAVESADFVVAHNAKFELGWLRRCGADISRILVFDTMIAEYVLWSNHPKRDPLKLGYITKKYGLGTKDPYIDVCMDNGVCPSELPESLLNERCWKDVRQTHELFLRQREKLIEQGKLAVQFTRCILTPVLTDIESRGLALDYDRVKAEYDKTRAEYDRLKAELDEFTGGINPRSGPQVAKFLYETLGFKELTDKKGKPIRGKASKQFPDGAPKTDKDTIAALEVTTPEQEKFAKLRNEFNLVAHALGTYLEFFLGVCQERDGIFYGSFNQTVTATQRLSSSGKKLLFKDAKKPKGAQLQNLPREYKPLFIAKDPNNFYFCEPDGAQLEFRVAGHIGRDIKIIQDIVDEVDAHTFTAHTLTSAGQPINRQGAKAHTFKPLYGGKSGTKAEKTYYQAFRKKYAGITETQEGWIKDVIYSNRKALRTETGLEFFFPSSKPVKPNKYTGERGYVENEASICNYPVQSLATADIIPIAVTKLWHELHDRDMQSHIVNIIHDSSPMEIHKEEVLESIELIIDSYTNYVYYYLKKVYGIDFLAPLGIGIKIGTHWSEGDEGKTQVNPPTRLEGVNYD